MSVSGSKPRLLGISGSLRPASFNTAILEAVRARVAERADLTLFPLNEIPLYNQDDDGPNVPAPVQALKAAFAECDGVVVSSPEYNYGMPGVLKNALDWASRPAMKSPMKGKPALIMTASPAYTGGVRAQQQVRETLMAALMPVVPHPQIVIAGVRDKVQDGRFTDETTLAFIDGGIDSLLADIAMRSATA